MASLSATTLIHNSETHIRQGDAHAGIAILEQVKQTFQTANAPKARRASNQSKQRIKELALNPRTALNVGPCASRKEIKKNYRKLALKYHPDKNQYTEDLFKVIQTAYDQIKDQPTPSKAPASRRNANSNYKQYYQQAQQQKQYHQHHKAAAAPPQPSKPSKPDAHRSHRSHRAGKHRSHRHHRPAGPNNNKENKQTNHRQSKPKHHQHHHHSSSASSASSSAKSKAEKEMKDFWTSGGKNFPFKFCREYPEAAAAMFAKMFRGGSIPTTNANATYEAFRTAFEKRGYGGKQHAQPHSQPHSQQYSQPQRRATPTPPPTIRAVSDLRALKGQIKKDSVALMWKGIEGALCYELRYKRTRDREWQSSSDSLRTSACRKNNLLPGTHYDFCVRAKFGPTGIWGPLSKPCTVRTISMAPDICVMRDVIEPADDSVRVRWRKPENNGAEIGGYELQWKHWGADIWKSANNLITGLECRKKNLLPGRRYEFRVRAKNNLGFGPYAAGVSGSTTNAAQDEKKRNEAAAAYARAEAEVLQAQKRRARKKKEDKEKKNQHKINKEKKSKVKKEKKEKKGKQERKEKKENKTKKNRRRPRPHGPPPPPSPQAAPPTTSHTEDDRASVASASATATISSYPNVELWYKMVDEVGHEYWWSESTGSVWDGPVWIDRWDTTHNAHYYEHRISGHTTWHKPADFVPIVPGG